jgi:hypothetical protein
METDCVLSEVGSVYVCAHTRNSAVRLSSNDQGLIGSCVSNFFNCSQSEVRASLINCKYCLFTVNGIQKSIMDGNYKHLLQLGHMRVFTFRTELERRLVERDLCYETL